MILGTQSFRRSRGIKPCCFYLFSYLARQKYKLTDLAQTFVHSSLFLNSPNTTVTFPTQSSFLSELEQELNLVQKIANRPCRILYIVKTRRRCSFVANSAPKSLPQLPNLGTLNSRSPVSVYIFWISVRRVSLSILHSLFASPQPSSLPLVLFLFLHIVDDLTQRNLRNLEVAQFLMTFFSLGCQ